METVIFQPIRSEPLGCRRLTWPTEGAGGTKTHIIKQDDDSFDKEAEAELLEQIPARQAMIRPMVIPPLEAPSEDDEEENEEEES